MTDIPIVLEIPSSYYYYALPSSSYSGSIICTHVNVIIEYTHMLHSTEEVGHDLQSLFFMLYVKNSLSVSIRLCCVQSMG